MAPVSYTHLDVYKRQMFPSSYNRVAMRKAEDKASNWKNDVIWFVSIEQKFYYDEYVEEESPIYDDKNNFTGETETRTVHKPVSYTHLLASK